MTDPTTDHATDATEQPTIDRLGPRSVERPADAGSTLVAGLEGVAPARVDGGGLTCPSGAAWSVDWWVGADDRWHLPSREPAVRQRRVGHGPIIETSLRVPSGDVVHTVYPVVVPGGTATVVEISNQSPVPVALAIAIRPYQTVEALSVEPGFRLDLDDRAVIIDGRPALILPRQPNGAAAATEELVGPVTSGRMPDWSGPVEGPGANGVFLYPLPHKTSLRFVIPGPGAGVVDVDGVPDAEASSRGWTAVVDRASRYEFPDSGITGLCGAARARLLLASADLPDRVVAVDPDAGPVLAGLAEGGHITECRTAVLAFAGSFPTSVPSAAAGELALGLGLAARLLDDRDLAEQLLEPLTQLTQLVDRAAGGRRLLGKRTAADRSTGDISGDIAGNRTAGNRMLRNHGRIGLALVADLAGQGSAAADLVRDVTPAQRPNLASVALSAEQAAPAQRWDGAGMADDPVAAARFWLSARRLLIDHDPQAALIDGRPVVELLPDFPTAWRGGTAEVHRAPVAGARVSFAIRWHGYRPALLWEVEGGDQPVTLRCQSLDPDWETTDRQGETLLAGSADELRSIPGAGDSFS